MLVPHTFWISPLLVHHRSSSKWNQICWICLLLNADTEELASWLIFQDAGGWLQEGVHPCHDRQLLWHTCDGQCRIQLPRCSRPQLLFGWRGRISIGWKAGGKESHLLKKGKCQSRLSNIVLLYFKCQSTNIRYHSFDRHLKCSLQVIYINLLLKCLVHIRVQTCHF